MSTTTPPTPTPAELAATVLRLQRLIFNLQDRVGTLEDLEIARKLGPTTKKKVKTDG